MIHDSRCSDKLSVYTCCFELLLCIQQLQLVEGELLTPEYLKQHLIVDVNTALQQRGYLDIDQLANKTALPLQVSFVPHTATHVQAVIASHYIVAP
jgi:E3 UFM1-protein ligase 1